MTDRPPLSGLQDRFRILVSFHYYRTPSKELVQILPRLLQEPFPQTFLDSGAFSAMSQGAMVDLQDYAAYIVRNRHLITTYANLDVIGDAEGTWQNQLRMEAMGLSPIPVFHAGSPWSYLERYIDKYPYIALGGIAGKMNPPMNWLVKCHQMAKGRSVFHGFGITSWKVLRDIPWYSVDSSSWGTGFRFGRVPVFDPRKGAMVPTDLGDQVAWRRLAPLLRNTYDLDYRDFADRSRNTRFINVTLGCMSFLKAEEWMARRHGPIRMPGSDQVGLKLFLADTDPVNFSLAQEGLRLHRGSVASATPSYAKVVTRTRFLNGEGPLSVGDCVADV